VTRIDHDDERENENENETGMIGDEHTISPGGGGIAVPTGREERGGQRVGQLPSSSRLISLSGVLAAVAPPRSPFFGASLFWPRGGLVLAPSHLAMTAPMTTISASAPPAAPSAQDAVPDGPGMYIRTVRKDKGLSRRAVARAAGFSRRELNAFEQGRREPSLSDWRCLAGSLGVDLDEVAPLEVLFRDGQETQDQRIEVFLGGSDPGRPALDLAIEHLDDAVAVDGAGINGTGIDPAGAYDRLPTGAEDWRATRARKRVERRWRDLHARVADVSHSYERVMRAGPADDLHELLIELEEATQRVRTSAAFERSKARHRIALDHYHGGLADEFPAELATDSGEAVAEAAAEAGDR
jgi:transcriptional regulator with XRE-family HTH domain